MQMGLEKLDIKTMKKVPSYWVRSIFWKLCSLYQGCRVSVKPLRVWMFEEALLSKPDSLNDATIIIHASFRFFSAFTPDVVKNVEYTKAVYCWIWRATFVGIDISSRDGNKKKFMGSVESGPQRQTHFGRADKNGKTSFLVGARLPIRIGC